MFIKRGNPSLFIYCWHFLACGNLRWEQAQAMANGSAWHCALGQEHVAVGLRHPSSSVSTRPRKESNFQDAKVPEDSPAAAVEAAAAAAVETVSLFATPVVVVRVPALLAAWKQAPIDDAALVDLALEGYRDAHAEGTFTDEVRVLHARPIYRLRSRQRL